MGIKRRKHRRGDEGAGRAFQWGRRTLLLTGAGGLAMLGGFVLLANAAGTYRFHEILDRAPTGTDVDVALLLILLGVATKSAQYPFHGWLPGATGSVSGNG